MALRILQFGIVFAIGYYLGPASPFAGVAGAPETSLSIQLKDPKDVTVRKSHSAILKCEAKSFLSAELQITWLHNDNQIPSNDTKRRMQDDGSLYIPKVGGKGNGLTGEYRCKATVGNVSVLSNPAKLKIASFGDFIHQPSNLSVPESQPAVLFCNIHSVPAAQIKWEQNYKPLPHNTRYVPLPTGALLITKTHSSDAGSYRCIATNSLLKKTKQSKIVMLTVSSIPMETVAPTFLPLDILPNTTVLVGENTSLYCAVSGWPIPTVQWLNNNSIVISNSSVLQIRNVSLHHAGNYSCRASNSVGRLLEKYTLDVLQKPYFNVTPTSINYPPARTVRLDCKAEGVPKPKIYWLKNGEPLPHEARIKRQATGLVFSHTFSRDAGIYQCFAFNSVGKIWAAAQLNQTTYNIPSPPEHVQCRSFNDGSICLTWQQPENISVTAYSIYSFYTGATGIETSGPEYVTNKTYHLATGLSTSTKYTFYVRLYSKVASDQSQAVTCKTGAIGKRDLQVTPLNDTSVQLTWAKISSDVPCDGTKIFYKVQWKRKGRTTANSDHTKGFSYVVNGLSYSVEYEFRVTSTWLKNDNSPWITYLSLGKDSTQLDSNSTELIPLPPEHLEATRVSPNSINLTWFDVNDNTKYYSICVLVAIDNEKQQTKCEETTLIKSVNTIYQITDLKPETLYEFKVRAHSFDGYFSQFSQATKIRTPADVPSYVLNLSYEIINESTVCLHWQAPLRKSGKLIKYLVSYSPNPDWLLDKWFNKSILTGKNANKGCRSDGNEETFSTLLVDLEPEIEYAVYVRAISDVGIGKPNYPIKLTTKIVQNVESPELEDDIQYNQKLGIIMGVTISLTCIVFCISCILVRKKCLKNRAFARARMAASNNYYPAVAHYASEGSSVQVRLENPCSAEIHEIEHLVSDDCTNHIPPVTPAHLDTKGTDGLPNGHINGSAKPYINGHIANGIVHITENPRYYALECNGYKEKKPKTTTKEEMFCSPYEEDSNSNLKTSKFYDLHRIFENSKAVKIPGMTNHHKSNHQCNFNKKTTSNDSNKSKSFKDNSSPSSSEDGSLNSTQVTTCLDNSFIMSVNNHRRVSPILGPNG